MAKFYFEQTAQHYARMAYKSDAAQRWEPQMDVCETDHDYQVHLELPGVKKQDLKLSLQDNTLIVSGAREPEQGYDNLAFLRMEIIYGEFRREVRFAEQVVREKVKASYEQGILKVVLPKHV